MSPQAETAAQQVQRRVRAPRRLAAVARTGLLDTQPEEAFDRLARVASVTLEAPLAFVTVVDEERSFWKARVGIDEGGPSQNTVEESFCQYVIGSGTELVVDDAASDPRTRENPSVAAMGVAAWLGFPLHAPDGEVLGSFCVVDTRTRAWTDRDVEVLRTLASAAAGEIALRAAAQDSRDLARMLQETLLPPVAPRVPGLRVAARYRAGGAGAEVMGDFYDVFETEGGRWSAVLGDVCGKGVQAAKVTGLARYTLRAGATAEPEPSQALALLNAALDHATEIEDRFVTAVLLALDPTPNGFDATLCSAGHVPALLRTADGCAEVGRPGSLLGVIPEPVLEDVRFPLAPGDVVVLCTDGVTEARSPAGEIFGLDRLAALVCSGPADADALADAISAAIEAWCAGPAQDDVALLVLRVEPATR